MTQNESVVPPDEVQNLKYTTEVCKYEFMNGNSCTKNPTKMKTNQNELRKLLPTPQD